MEAYNRQKLNENQPDIVQSSPILMVPIDDLKVFLEHVKIDDLYSLGLTCKHLHQITGEFYRQNFPFEYIGIRKIKGKWIQQTNTTQETNFGCFANELWIMGQSGDNMECFRFVANLKNNNLKKITFFNCANFTIEEGQSLAETLKSVEHVEFSKEKRSLNNFNHILKFCPNLKSLKVWNHSAAIEWPKQNYEMLERLDVYNKVGATEDRLNGLKEFLQINPQIKHLAIGTYKNTNVSVNDVLLLLEDINMKLDILELESDNFKTEESMSINAFQERGLYKELQITCSGDQKNSFINLHHIPCLTALKIQNRIFDINAVANMLAKIPNLKKFEMEQLVSKDHAEVLSKSLSNVEMINLRYGPLEYALPFVENLPNLEMIQIHQESSGIQYKVQKLNEARKKLVNAKQLTIELHEPVFHQFKWASIDLDYELIKIQRASTKIFCINNMSSLTTIFILLIGSVLWCTVKAISNGEDAEYRPYHMFLSSSDPGHAFGSGIMISRRHILTSASLISGFTRWHVGHSSANLSQIIQIESTFAFVHPKYDLSSNAVDLGIIILRDPLNVPTVEPIDLPITNTSIPRVNQEGEVVGFGITSYTDLPAPHTQLQKSYFIVTNNTECPHDNFEQHSRYNFCARDTFMRSQLCHGDIGTAFVVSHRGVDMLAGITNGISSNCSETTDGSTYVKIQEFLPWIQNIINL
ncbi:Chymotrypsinogen 2 [Pseudolycoriella hygida]|uniref:Chymotrypsinogen 2 n=1 Tax=Pseudolycoriella hygida TaxID=35572 RepID=A0A9Q0NCF0_9DIPT|nr:Chymotrypsinogen 2 [Pseudolycoriella hygida]